MENKSLKRSPGGNWVVGEHFWGREKELGLFIEEIEAGAHILLVAQRRIGKTSLMREAARRLEGRYICLFIDLENAHSPADAIVELSVATRPHASLWEKTKQSFSNILGSVKERIDSIQIDELKVTLRSGVTGGDWSAKGDQLFATLAASEVPVVIFCDEVPILVNRLLKGDDYRITPERRQQTDAFLSWLRKMSSEHQGKVRLVITGSIGIEPILRQAGLSATLNTFSPFELEPWSGETAIGCLKALAETYSLTFSEDAVEKIVELLGVCIPHHVQMFFDNIYRTCRMRERSDIDEALVQDVYDNNMLSVRGHAELSHMEERLKMVLGPESQLLALDFLTEASVVGRLDAVTVRTLSSNFAFEQEDQHAAGIQHEILDVLEHDGYLRRDGEEYVFVSRLLRDWWKRRFGLGYVPIAERRK